MLFIVLAAGLFAGCAATRPISDVALGAGGAYLGNKLSNGDPLATAAGAGTDAFGTDAFGTNVSGAVGFGGAALLLAASSLARIRQ